MKAERFGSQPERSVFFVQKAEQRDFRHAVLS
jgi:hypothetical protein